MAVRVVPVAAAAAAGVAAIDQIVCLSDRCVPESFLVKNTKVLHTRQCP